MTTNSASLLTLWNRGLWLDLQILFRTAGVVMSRKGAH